MFSDFYQGKKLDPDPSFKKTDLNPDPTKIPGSIQFQNYGLGRKKNHNLTKINPDLLPGLLGLYQPGSHTRKLNCMVWRFINLPFFMPSHDCKDDFSVTRHKI